MNYKHNEGLLCVKKRVHTLEEHGPWDQKDLDVGWPQRLMEKFNYWEEFNWSALDKAQISDEKSIFEPDKIASEPYCITQELRQKEYIYHKAEKYRRKAELLLK